MKFSNAPVLELLSHPCPLVIGHRGFCAIAPENTLLSFHLAIEAGAGLIELDYHHSKDGVPMVIHDSTLDRTTDARKRWKQKRIRVSEKTAAEIQTLDAGSWFHRRFAGTRVPLLTQALDTIQSSGGITLIEHKSGDAETLATLLRDMDLINDVVVQSFDWQFLREFHQLEPRQVLGALGPPVRLASGRKPSWRSKKLSQHWLNELEKTGARIAVWNRQVSKAAVQAASERGLGVWVYTINEAALAARLIEAGVTGIITNDPRELCSHCRHPALSRCD